MASHRARTGKIWLMEMKRLTLLCLIALIIFVAPSLAAAGISVTLKLDREEASQLDAIEMVVRVSGTQRGVSQPVVKGLESFAVTRGGTSTRVEIINGKFNAGIDYTYLLQPKSMGTFTIGPAEVSYQGKTYRSDTSKLLILKSAKGSGDDEGPLFLKASLSSKKVFVEEQAGRQAPRVVDLLVRVPLGALHLDANVPDERLGRITVRVRGADPRRAAAPDEEPPFVIKLVAPGIAADVVEVVEDEDLRVTDRPGAPAEIPP